MNLNNTIVVAGDPTEVFALLQDVERVASCMPGTKLLGQTGDAHIGEVKIKVGPLSVTYDGELRFLEVDPDQNTLVMKASGKETTGNGGAEAHMKVAVNPDPGGSTISIDTDLLVRGRVAQFGRGAIAEVSSALVEEFARNLGELSANGTAPGGPGLSSEEGFAQGAPSEAADSAMSVGPILLSLLRARALLIAKILLGAVGLWAVLRPFRRRLRR
jgi:uncharacterized protein